MYKHDMTNHPERKYKYHKTKYKPTTPTSTPTNTIRPDNTKDTLSSNDDNTNDTLSTNDDKQDPLKGEPTTTDPPDPKHDINDRNLSSDRPDVISDPPVNKNNNDIKHDPPEIETNESKSEIIVENINSNENDIKHDPPDAKHGNESIENLIPRPNKNSNNKNMCSDTRYPQQMRIKMTLNM